MESESLSPAWQADSPTAPRPFNSRKPVAPNSQVSLSDEFAVCLGNGIV